jgi:hypothetical protein
VDDGSDGLLMLKCRGPVLADSGGPGACVPDSGSMLKDIEHSGGKLVVGMSTEVFGEQA